MSDTIKLNEGIEGAEVRDALKWVKHITENDINRMKIGRKGFLFSFIDPMHVIAGKVFIPSSGELWHSEKEVGFNCERLFNAFSIFNRRDKTELYVKENRLFLKNGALKWRYDMEEVEQAQKIDFSNIPTPSIRINIRDILPFKSINKGKRGSDKKGMIGFKYGNGKATMFVADIVGNDIIGKSRIEVGEVEAEGEGVGVALYNLVFLEKLLKDAKSGYLRIEENKPAQLKIHTGKKTKAILYLARMFDSDLIEEIRGEGLPSTGEEKTEEESEEVKELKNDIKADEETLEKAEKEEVTREPEAGEEEIFNADVPRLEEDIRQAKAELDRIQEQEKIEQEKAKGFREAIYKSEIVAVCFFNYLEGTKDTIYRDAEGYEYQSNALNFDTLEIEKIKELKRIDKAATGAAEQVEREKTEEAFKETEAAVDELKDAYKEKDKPKARA